MKRLAALATGMVALTVAPAGAQSLDATIALAEAHAPVLVAARDRADEAADNIDAARAQSRPQATVQGQIGAGWIDPRGFFGLHAANVTPRSAGASIEWPLYNGGRVGAATRQAEAAHAAALAGVGATALMLLVETVRTYVAALSAEARRGSYAGLVAALDETVRGAGLRFRTGDGTSTEVAQARARQAEARAAVAGAEGQRDTALAQLRALTGVDIAPETALPPAPALPESLDDTLARATRDNPQLAQSQHMVDAAHAAVSAARAERMPTIGLYAEAATVRDEFFPGYKADSASFGIRGRWTLFDAGRTGAKVRGAEAEESAQQADAAGAEANIEAAATEAWARMRAARAVLAAADDRAAATAEALRGTQLEVKTGAKPQLAMLDAEREDIEAHAAEIEARGDMLVAAWELRAVAGMGGAR